MWWPEMGGPSLQTSEALESSVQLVEEVLLSLKSCTKCTRCALQLSCVLQLSAGSPEFGGCSINVGFPLFYRDASLGLQTKSLLRIQDLIATWGWVGDILGL